jgi:hypothetical protein
MRFFITTRRGGGETRGASAISITEFADKSAASGGACADASVQVSKNIRLKQNERMMTPDPRKNCLKLLELRPGIEVAKLRENAALAFVAARGRGAAQGAAFK